MSATGLLSLLAAVLLCSLLVNVLVVWHLARWLKAPRHGFGRALLTVLLTWLVNLGLLLVELRWFSESSLALIPLVLGGVVVPFVLVRRLLQTSLGHSLILCVLWLVVATVYGGLVVLGLQAGVAEGFVIPTGSMAETLRGYHKQMTCPECGYPFAVGCSMEMESEPGRFTPVRSCTCPNCRFVIDDMVSEVRSADPGERHPMPRMVSRYPTHGGDRLLVAKSLFGLAPLRPGRLDLIVFRYPPNTLQPEAAKVIYVDRVIGLPGETVALCGGDVLLLPPEESPRYDSGGLKPADLWQPEHIHHDDPQALELFRRGAFRILRKPPDMVLALAQSVYDNDHPAPEQEGQLPPRWYSPSGKAWHSIEPHGFRCEEQSDHLEWLRYRHLLRNGPGKPQLITDFSGYNSGLSFPAPFQHWVGDLMLECEVTVETASGEMVLELSRGANRFRASWNLETGACRLVQRTGDEEKTVASQPTGLTAGTHRVRLANVDARLIVWVDDLLPFGDGVACEVGGQAGPTTNDLEPASIGVRQSAVRVHKLRLWRDVYFTPPPDQPAPLVEEWHDPHEMGRIAPPAGQHLLRSPQALLRPGRQQPAEFRQPRVGSGPRTIAARACRLDLLSPRPSRVGSVRELHPARESLGDGSKLCVVR